MRKYGTKRPKGYQITAKVRDCQDQNLRWTPDELRLVRNAVASNCTLDQVHALMPYRSKHSVKDQFYRAREPRHEPPASLNDARRRKDAVEGSRMLLERLIEAHPEMYPRQVMA